MKGIAIFGVLLYLMFTTSGHANADPADVEHNALLVCKWLNVDSTPHGFMVMIADMQKNGVNADEGADALVYAATTICPWYADELQAAIDYYANPNLRKHAV